LHQIAGTTSVFAVRLCTTLILRFSEERFGLVLLIVDPHHPAHCQQLASNGAEKKNLLAQHVESFWCRTLSLMLPFPLPQSMTISTTAHGTIPFVSPVFLVNVTRAGSLVNDPGKKLLARWNLSMSHWLVWGSSGCRWCGITLSKTKMLEGEG